MEIISGRDRPSTEFIGKELAENKREITDRYSGSSWETGHHRQGGGIRSMGTWGVNVLRPYHVRSV